MVDRKRLTEEPVTPPVAADPEDDPLMVWLRNRLAINENRLDQALIEQPELYRKVAEAHVSALADRDAAKLYLDEKEAAVSLEIRDSLKDEGGRPTEGRIAQLMQNDPAIQKAQRKLLDRRRTADLWLALKEAYHQRSFMLRELVAIRLAEYGNLTIERGSRHAGSVAAPRS